MAITPTKRALHGQEVRTMVIKTASILFRQYGVDSVSMRDLAEKTGLTNGTLYHYFKAGKSDIVEAVAAAHTLENQSDMEILAKIPGSIMKLWTIFTQILVNRILNDGVEITRSRVTCVKNIKKPAKMGSPESEIRGYIHTAFEEKCFREDLTEEMIHDFLMSVFRYCAYQYGILTDTPDLAALMRRRMYIALTGLLSADGLKQFSPEAFPV